MEMGLAIAVCLVCLILASSGRAGKGAGWPEGSPKGEADLARMKGNFVSYWTGAEANRDDPMVAASLHDLEESAGAALGAIRPDGSWEDIGYRAVPGHEFRVARHVSRVQTMAEGFRTPGQSLCGNAELARAVEQSLSFVHGLLGEHWPKSGGWWQQQVHTPRKLGETLLLMEGSVDPAIAAKVESTIRYLLMEDAPGGQGVIWHVTLLAPSVPPAEAQRATGENMVWVAMNHLYLALLTNDAEKAGLVQAAVAGQCAIQSGATRQPFNEGIKEDYSFHQHGPLLYTGGYGRSFFEDVPHYLWIARDTRYQIPAAGIEMFAHYVLDSSLWCIYENYYDPSCRGREIARPERRPMEVPLALLVLANVANPRQDEAISAAKSFYQVNPGYRLRTEPLWSAIKGSRVAASVIVGHKHFWESDYTVHRREGSFASLRMFSDRTRAAECIHMEGKTSWHQSDGMLWVFLRGGDYAAHSVLPTLDWLRLPGTTVERKQLKPAEGIEGWPPPTGQRAFVGGAFTKDRGTSAMELAAAASVLTARKSWFFFGDEIICLGSDINCPSDNPAETIVNQWPLSDAATPLTIDSDLKPSSLPWSEEMLNPKWAHCDGVGYYFPQPARLKVRRAVQSGSWRDLSDSQADTVHSNPFLTLWFDHGTRAKGAAYAYAILPRKTAAQTEAYAAADEITILAHDSRAHAVRQNARNAVGVVFWEPGSVGKLSADRACIAFYEETADGFTLAVTDPTHQASTFRVTTDQPLTPVQLPPGVTSTIADGKTIITYSAENGRNYLARFVSPR
jgi:hypothetical protein